LLPRRTLVPIGGGKDSLVSIELLKSANEPATAVWIGNSPLIAACAARTGLPTLNIGREISPILFEYNKDGAYNGHIPVTAINSAILAVAAVLYGFDTIAFSNERSASSATLEYDGQPVNHQWSKGWEFERTFHALLKARVAADLHYFSLLRPLSELAVAAFSDRSRPIAGAGNVRSAISFSSRSHRSCRSRACSRSSAAICSTTRRWRARSMR
jgi:hypothetical protein